LHGKKILVTGGSGFLGSHVTRMLRQKGYEQLMIPRSSEHDLRNPEVSRKLLLAEKPDIVIHLAASVGGIEANRLKPATFFYDNAAMGIHLMEAARQANVEKFVICGTICSYPKYGAIPLREEELWEGYPEETNAPYGLAKKMLLVQAQAYREQYGFRSVYLLPVNLFGPRDNFDPVSSHVIPALIRKCIEAKEQGVPVVKAWGTGQATREFLYVEDAAEAIVMAAERYDGAEPVNVGTGREIRIEKLAELIAGLTGFTGRFEWDTTKPDGQPRRCLEVSRAERYFGFKARTTLEEGLRKTIEWYEGMRRKENGEWIETRS
jgi:GDP-L-fucose synthase